jgi:hypothetical protein
MTLGRGLSPGGSLAASETSSRTEQGRDWGFLVDELQQRGGVSSVTDSLTRFCQYGYTYIHVFFFLEGHFCLSLEV